MEAAAAPVQALVLVLGLLGLVKGFIVRTWEGKVVRRIIIIHGKTKLRVAKGLKNPRVIVEQGIFVKVDRPRSTHVSATRGEGLRQRGNTMTMRRQHEARWHDPGTGEQVAGAPPQGEGPAYLDLRGGG